jgi:hypothetical protein
MTRRGFERRRAPRIPTESLGGAISVVGAKLVNVSLYGMMIASPVPMELEAVLRLRLVIDGEKSDVETRVVECMRMDAGARRQYGIGLGFTDVPGETRRQLERALAALPDRTPRS